jgi:rare lipoprotein A (peptidoglycan hydrolase)
MRPALSSSECDRRKRTLNGPNSNDDISLTAAQRLNRATCRCKKPVNGKTPCLFGFAPAGLTKSAFLRISVDCDPTASTAAESHRQRHAYFPKTGNRGILIACVTAIVTASIVLAHQLGTRATRLSSDTDVTSSIRGAPNVRLIALGKPVPKGGGTYRIGDPYVVAGRTYVPREDPSYRAEGVASWYGEWFHGRLTANGEIYDMQAVSAAHPTLPLPSYVRVTNLENNASLIVRVNDRGPYHGDRLIDLSVKAAKLLGFHDRGLARVRVEYIGPAKIEGSDDARLVATLRYEEASVTDAIASLHQTAALDRRELLAPMPEIGLPGGAGPVHKPGPGAPGAIAENFPIQVFD